MNYGEDLEHRDTVIVALDGRTLWVTVVTLMRLFLGAWMIVSGYSYWAPHFGLPPGFPQPLGTLEPSNQMLVTMIEIGHRNSSGASIRIEAARSMP